MLSGLSSAQHKWELVNNTAAAAPEGTAAAATAWEEANTGVVDEDTIVAAPESWSVSPYLDEMQVFDERDRIKPLHPVYAIPAECVADIKAHFDAKQGF